jgi:heme-degrading monooxygenase HmoA
VFTSTLIFQPKEYDEDFHRLNDEIAGRARAIPGFLGEESWANEQTGLRCSVYYWETREALDELIGMPVHLEAKRQHERWIGPYRVVIAEVTASYGQAGLGLEHVPQG